jgi:hypothetical protein
MLLPITRELKFLRSKNNKWPTVPISAVPESQSTKYAKKWHNRHFGGPAHPKPIISLLNVPKYTWKRNKSNISNVYTIYNNEDGWTPEHKRLEPGMGMVYIVPPCNHLTFTLCREKVTWIRDLIAQQDVAWQTLQLLTRQNASADGLSVMGSYGQGAMAGGVYITSHCHLALALLWETTMQLRIVITT